MKQLKELNDLYLILSNDDIFNSKEEIEASKRANELERELKTLYQKKIKQLEKLQKEIEELEKFSNKYDLELWNS